MVKHYDDKFNLA
jgi:DNA replication licensing factor MCM3